MKKQSIFGSILLLVSLRCSADLMNEFNTACDLNKAGDIERASQLYKNIVDSYPYCTQALYNYAHTLKDLGDMHQAIDAYTKVINQEPENNFAHFGLSQCYLSLGMFAQGFALFDYRSRDIAQFKPHINLLKDFIERNVSLHGITILIRSEWGLGDCIQFIRYAKELKKRGATVLVQAYPALQKLFSLAPYIDSVISSGQAFPDHHLQIPLLSLAYIIGTSLEDESKNQPYLSADPLLIEQWKSTLKNEHRFKIGICWQGNGDKNAPPLLNKNIALEYLKPLCDLKNVVIYSLQRLEEKQQPPPNILVFDEQFDNEHGRFMDTAAVMKNLDLIITVDTSIAHLAGALGCPTWIMLPHRTDWRWLLNRNESPFYSSMQLFRQPHAGDWESVIQEICHKIEHLLNTQ